MKNLDAFPELFSDNLDYLDSENRRYLEERELEIIDREKLKTIVEWNQMGRVVKKSSKSISLRYSRVNLFHLNDTFKNQKLSKKYLKKQEDISKNQKYKTFTDWNKQGHVIKKGKKGIFSKKKQKYFFSEGDTFINRKLAKKLLREQNYLAKKTTKTQLQEDDIPF